MRLHINITLAALLLSVVVVAQHNVKLQPEKNAQAIDVTIDGKPFTSFLFPDTLEKPVLYPIYAADGNIVTRGYPLQPRPGEPTDHPHHIGLWMNYEKVNGLDFWNNSFAIPADKKKNYGWIKTDPKSVTINEQAGTLGYQARWTNQQNETLLLETTNCRFSAIEKDMRVIDRTTTLQAVTDVSFEDAKDGFLGLRLARELQMPALQDQKFTDSKGIVTVVKARADSVSNGNYLTSAGKTGDSAWSTRGAWCEVYGKMGTDSISVIIIDHPSNVNYPTFWHARGYGLFAANPLGENVFTNGQSSLNFTLKKGQSVTFRYRIVIYSNKKGLSPEAIGVLAKQFAGK